MSKIVELSKSDPKSLFEESVKKAHDYQDTYNSFVTILDNFDHTPSESPINGIPYALKDNYSTKGILTTGSSNLLKDYVPVYDSTVYEKLKNAGAVLVGKTVLDEFAMGGSGTTGHTGAVKNPWDTNRQAGGSSAGSAASVALGIVPFSIGSDTGDSVRKPAAYCGIVGFKPTYGRISRYGLFAFASSLDHVGIFSTTVKDAAIVTDVLKGLDDKDLTTLENDNEVYADSLEKDVKGKKLFYIKELLENESDNEIVKEFYKTIEKYKSVGVEIVEESFDKQLLNSLYPVYHVISSAEATSNLANETGIIFGSREDGKTATEVMVNTRTKGFSEFIKRRFILGSYVLQKENQEKLFLNACRIRRLVVEKMNSLFEKYDGLILPVCPIAPLLNESNSEKITNTNYALDNHLVIGNFGGYPSITIPMGFVDNMPIGINITCAAKNDALTLNLGYQLEKVIDFESMKKGRK